MTQPPYDPSSGEPREQNDPGRPIEPAAPGAEQMPVEEQAPPAGRTAWDEPAPTAPLPGYDAGSYGQQPPAAAEAYQPPGGYAYAPPPTGDYAQPPGVPVLPGTQLATPGRRIGGWLLDLLLLIVTLWIGWFVWSLIVWARGQTPAKQILDMRCYRPSEGRVAHWGWMALRQVVGGIVEGLFGGLVFVVSAIMMIVSDDHKAIHDHIAGTIVLYDPEGVLQPG